MCQSRLSNAPRDARICNVGSGEDVMVLSFKCQSGARQLNRGLRTSATMIANNSKSKAL